MARDRTRPSRRGGALVVALLMVAGCAKPSTLDPPEIRYGQDVCVQCGMIVSDERFAAATVERDASGRTVKHVFDDFGCVLARDGTGTDILVRYVRAHSGDRWLRAEDAKFLHSRAIHSPMAFGLAACPDAPTADALSQRFPGDVIDLRAVRQRYAGGALAWMPDSREVQRSDR